MRKIRNGFLFAFCLLLFASTSVPAQKIRVHYSPAAFTGPFSGKVILYLSKEEKEPRASGLSSSFCCFAITVNGIKPNTEVVFDDSAVSFPARLSRVERGPYYAQVVWD